MSENLTITVPEPLLTRLNRFAQAVQRPVEEVVLSTLRDSIPAPPQGLPADIRDELSALELLSDEELLRTAHSILRQDEGLSTAYVPGEAPDRLALRKAYAFVLLKWRGRPVDELESLAG